MSEEDKGKNGRCTKSDPASGSIKNVLWCWFVAVLIMYFSVSAIGKANLNREQIEATRLHIKVLKLQLQELEENVKHEPRGANE